MRLDLENLPTDTALLHQLVREMAGFVGERNGEIDRLKAIIKQLQRAQFGRRSAPATALRLKWQAATRAPRSGSGHSELGGL
jgi:hypothetical protein